MHSDPVAPTSSAVRIPIDLRRLPWVRRLAADYAYHFPAVAPFFAGDPASPDAWREAIGRAQHHARPRAEMATVLRAQQQRRGAPLEAMEAAGLLADSRSVAVVTGQQAGLFGGPLFTLLKAITTIRLAERMSRDYDVPAVAVFWIDAEDHDWDEVASCTVLDSELLPQTVTLPRPKGAGESPVALIHLDRAVDAALDELARGLPPSDFSTRLLDDLRRAYRPSTGMAEAFGRWIETVLGGRGLVVFDSSDPAAKRLAGSIFERELRSPGRTTELAARAGSELVGRGYHAQVSSQPDSLALFHLDGIRRPMRLRDRHVVVGDTVRPVSALLDEAMTTPARFSPNVVLRPIVQDLLFPTACYVAGPNELAYLAQLRDVYTHFDVPMPLLYPRATATILDAAAIRFLSRYDLPLETLQPQDEAALNRMLEAQLPASVFETLEKAGRAMRERMSEVIAAAPAIDPTLAGVAQSTLERLERDLTTLHTKIIHAAKRRNETLRRQFRHVQAQAFPSGHPQERVVGFVSFLNHYGPVLVDRLLADLPLDLGQHWVITI